MKKYTRNVLWDCRPLGDMGQGILIPKVSQKTDLTSVIQLNETAFAIWDALTEPSNVEEICEILKKEFEMNATAEKELRSDIQKCLDLFCEMEVLS